VHRFLVACQSSDVPTASSASRLPADAAVVHTRQRIPIVVDDTIENPCNGENMAFHFDELLVAHDLLIEGKSFHTHVTQMDRGSNGVGLTTGFRYRQVGAQTSTAFFTGQVQTVQTFVNAVKLIGQAGAPSFLAHETLHLTVTPQGNVSVELDKFTFTCR
jgi:hypothetical protein